MMGCRQVRKLTHYVYRHKYTTYYDTDPSPGSTGMQLIMFESVLELVVLDFDAVVP